MMNAVLREFVKPKKLECVESSADETYAKFVAEPLERGFGVSLGNSLRRYLLSSIPGASIVAVKIAGIHHEFSTLPNVYEDVSDIILNLKEVVIAQEGTDAVTLTIDEKGKKEVTGADIKCPPGVQIVNPDVHIASLMDKKSEFKVEMFTRVGRGYLSSEDIKVEEADISVIPLDANFSPIRKVNFTVEKTRVGGSADFDKLILEVWTNGTIDPETAVSNAARIHREHIQLFINVGEEEEAPRHEARAERKRPTINLNRSVEELELSVRSYNCLQKANIKTIRELVTKTDSEMLKTRNFGRKSLNEIKQILGEMGLSLGMGEDEVRTLDAEQ
ncbi:MAG: DNA-directed RNA polymerase subunit alpha [Nitrospinae bacterium]|nr:DNA-directed RNA polymerase subunit alpha [Nitrospinota bacterium]